MFDVWHFAKNIKTKLRALKKHKNYEAIGDWIQAAGNHLWYCANNCRGDAVMIK